MDELKCRLNEMIEDWYEDDPGDAFGSVILREIETDDESPARIGRHLANLVMDSSDEQAKAIDEAMIILTGWSLSTLVNKAEEYLAEQDETLDD